MAEDTGLRRTKQRKQLLDILQAKTEPLTADQILRICQLECPNMALTTVYRNLDRMIELGVATKITHLSGVARFTVAKPNKKVVLFCRMCQCRFELDDVSVEALETQIEKKSGFEIEHRYMEFYGLCPKCQRRML